MSSSSVVNLKGRVTEAGPHRLLLQLVAKDLGGAEVQLNTTLRIDLPPEVRIDMDRTDLLGMVELEIVAVVL